MYEQHPGQNPNHINRELRDVFEPLCDVVAAESQPDHIALNDPEILERMQIYPTHVMPSRLPSEHLPSDILHDADLSKLPALRNSYHFEREHDPLSSDSLQALSQLSGGIVEAWVHKHPEHTEKAEYLDVMLDRSVLSVDAKPFDMDKWKEWETTFVALPAEEQQQVEAMRATRANNVAKWEMKRDHSSTRQTNTVAHIHNPDLANLNEQNAQIVADIVVPVGEYGKDFADDLLKTTVAMQSVAQKHAHTLAEELTQSNEKLLLENTVRAGMNDSDDGEASPQNTMAVVHEGILSITQSLAILTCEKVEGYDDPHELVRDIIDAGLVSRLARFSPMGFVGPMSLSGRFMTGSLVRTEDGVKFSDEFEAFLKQEKMDYIAELMLLKQVDAEEGIIDYRPLGKVCPVSNIGGGIDKMSDSYSALLNAQGNRIGR